MESHRRRNSWLTIGVGGCCVSRDDIASEKKGHSGMLSKFPSSYLAALTAWDLSAFIALCKMSLQLHVGGCTPVCLAVNDPHHVELHNHLAYSIQKPSVMKKPQQVQHLSFDQLLTTILILLTSRTISCTNFRATSGHANFTDEPSGPASNNKSTREPTYLAMGHQQSRVRSEDIIPYEPFYTCPTQAITFST